MKCRFLLLLAGFILVNHTSSLFAQKCEIKEESRTIKTYPFSDPNPIPVLVRKPTIYPYFSFNSFSHVGKPRTWKVVRLENDHVKAFVMPESGGKLYGAVEKSTGKEFVYLNNVMKFRQIALRGPWTSGGSEFNFGVVGHAPSCSAPVDYRLLENPDGSVSCVVGAMDLPSRTRWSVTVTLPRDKAFLEIRPMWYNPSPFHQSYYAWINNAVKTGDDLQYFYPGRFAVSHSTTIPPESWPVDGNGRDLSWYKNNNFGRDKSHFVFGKYADYFGGYWHADRFGFGHWALYDDMPGRKMWIWALSPQGGIWENLLTDTDGQYSEPQSGRLLSQINHEFFTPYTCDTWREILFPFKEIGGLAAASPHAALNVSREGSAIEIGLCALQTLDDDLVVLLDGKEVLRERLVLDPMGVYRKRLDLPASTGSLQVRVAGKLSYCDDPRKLDVHRPFNFKPVEGTTAEALYLVGLHNEKARRYTVALAKYLGCLEKEPLHVRALTRAAELYCRRAEYRKGLELAARALKISMYDPEANYAYGVLSRYTDDLVDAKETLGWAARSLKYRSNAYCQMAEICILEKNFDLALEYARRSLDFNRFNLRSFEVLAVIHRKQGKTVKAGEVLSRLLAIDPLNHFARFERHQLDSSPENLDAFRSMIRSELPHETYLEMAVFYNRLGLDGDAVALLEHAPVHPTVCYWLAYLLREMPGQSSAWLEKAGRFSPAQVFPFREETIPVMKWVIRTVAKDWKPKYYLGLIYWGKGRVKEARELFDACGKTGYAPFYMAFGSLDKTRAASHFRNALAADEGDWRTWHCLVDLCNNERRLEEALELTEKAFRKFPGHVVVAMDRAKSLFQSGRYHECLKLLEKIEMLPYEGAWEGHHLFLHAWIRLAADSMKRGDYREAIECLEKSRAYPEHLGTGRTFDPDFRLQDHLLALCRGKTGDERGAEEIRKGILDYTLRNRAYWGWYHYFGLLALHGAGENEKAAGILKDLESRFPRDPRIQWCSARFSGNLEKAAEIEKTNSGDPRFELIREVAEFAPGTNSTR